MRSGRRGLLAAWAATIAAIVALSVYGRPIQRAAAAAFGDARQAVVVAILVLAAAGAILLAARAGGRAAVLRASVLVPLLALGLWLVPLAEERIHFLVFGVFGAVTFAAFEPRIASVLAIAVAAGDEVLQGALPDRYFDVRDIAMNSISALAGGWITKGISR
jgi:hypothetical protein